MSLSSLAIAGCFGGQSSESAATSSADRPASSGGEAPDEGAQAAERAQATESGDVTAQDGELVPSMAGEWHLAERDAEAQIDRAITEVTDQMSFFTRGIANGRIDESVNPDERVSIEADGEHVVVAIGEGRPVRMTLNGPAVATTAADGRSLRTRAIVHGGRLSIEEQTDEGTRILTFQPRGDALVMTTRIRSDRLPDEIEYGLRYRRADGGEVARR